ncbi:hypothetical protein SDC9_69293 [bioreactor metagenome]|uniref:Uncharacterized protein n=1 Tax=bioreactor metagenome TaxID=1076179 RepID=A0A644Y9P9_9ZZZZ
MTNNVTGNIIVSHRIRVVKHEVIIHPNTRVIILKSVCKCRSLHILIMIPGEPHVTTIIVERSTYLMIQIMVSSKNVVQLPASVPCFVFFKIPIIHFLAFFCVFNIGFKNDKVFHIAVFHKSVSAVIVVVQNIRIQISIADAIFKTTIIAPYRKTGIDIMTVSYVQAILMLMHKMMIRKYYISPVVISPVCKPVPSWYIIVRLSLIVFQPC